MNRIKSNVASVAAMVLLVSAMGLPAHAKGITSTHLQADLSNVESKPPGKGEIKIYTSKSEQGTRGWYAHAGSIVLFETGYEAGTSKADKGRVAVRLEVNGTVIDVTVDKKSGTVVMDGHGAMLLPEDVQILADFYPELEKALVAPHLSRSKRAQAPSDLPADVEALHRLATMMSEAPAGIVLNKRIIERPRNVSTSPFESHEPPVIGRTLLAQDDVSLTKSCQRSGEQGIAYLYLPCNVVRYNTEYHDSTNHCYIGVNRAYGCKESTCKGRCGAGCGSFGSGRGTYTHDCHDHDWCVNFHKEAGAANPSHPSCGDEFWEADDDFWHGTWNCGNCR